MVILLPKQDHFTFEVLSCRSQWADGKKLTVCGKSTVQWTEPATCLLSDIASSSIMTLRRHPCHCAVAAVPYLSLILFLWNAHDLETHVPAVTKRFNSIRVKLSPLFRVLRLSLHCPATCIGVAAAKTSSAATRRAVCIAHVTHASLQAIINDIPHVDRAVQQS